MKRLSIFIFTLVFALSGPLAAEPKMTFETTEIDFGKIDSGKVKTLVFKFKNTGDETLIITKINSSCGCTVPEVEKMEYQPGESGVIPVKFDSKGLNGKVTKTVTISTNAKDHVNTILKIKGTVVLKDFAMIELEPAHVNFKEVKLGEEYSRNIKIKNTGTTDLRIIEVAHSPQVYLLFDKDVVGPAKEMEVKIVFTPMQAGRFAAFIRFRTNAHKRRLIIVKVSAE